MHPRSWTQDPMLFGAAPDEGVVAIESAEGGDGNEVLVFYRRDGQLQTRREKFTPFLVAEAGLAADCPGVDRRIPLVGESPINTLLRFNSMQDWDKTRRQLIDRTGEQPSSPTAPYLLIAGPVPQYMFQTGITCFKGMAFEELRRMQVDIECITTAGYDFCNAEREGDRIVAIAVSDPRGRIEVLNGAELDERTLLEQFVARVREWDPDVIEGHNLFNFDLPYLAARAARHGVKLALGRDGTEPRRRPGRFSAGERAIAYTRADIFGRHVVDTYLLVQAYDVTYRALDGYGLKPVAVHFGVAAVGRTYVDGGDITSLFHRDPARLMDYVRDDVIETRAVAALLSRSAFAQAQMLPMSYQDAALRGNAMKIDALMLREYLRGGGAIPRPATGHPIAGGYTDLFKEGVIRNVHHADVRSLYPSLMLLLRLGPASDHQGVFLKLLETLRAFRLRTKAAMQTAADGPERQELDALQTTFKILINSFYGYLGFAQARFNDFGVADRITAAGRKLLGEMVLWLEDHGAQPIEIDTDGIYYVPPAAGDDTASRAAFREAFAAALPSGIEIEFDGEYTAMYSHKMKNYALLQADGTLIVKGAALKSRGLERYQREFLRRMLRLRLEGRERDLPALKTEFDDALERRQLPIEALVKTETLSDTLPGYLEKRGRAGASRRAAYELILGATRKYRVGDQVAYYVTGTKKNVTVHENCKLASDWDPARRDENTAYYQARLDALYEKFGGGREPPRQGELFR